MLYIDRNAGTGFKFAEGIFFFLRKRRGEYLVNEQKSGSGVVGYLLNGWLVGPLDAGLAMVSRIDVSASIFFIR